VAAAYRAALWIGVPAYLGSAVLMLMARPESPIIKAEENQRKESAPLGLLIFLGIMFGVQIASENSIAMFANVYFATGLNMSDSLIGTVFASPGYCRLYSHRCYRYDQSLGVWNYHGKQLCADRSMRYLYPFHANCLAGALGFILFNLIVHFAQRHADCLDRNLYSRAGVRPWLLLQPLAWRAAEAWWGLWADV
jgi:hypothetical protein